jgi:hypothetical protein
MRVDLPAPFSPSSARTSLRATLSETSVSACTPGNNPGAIRTQAAVD